MTEQDIQDWTIKANQDLILVIKFKSSILGEQQNSLLLKYFQTLWNDYHPGWTIPLRAKTVYPEFNKNPANRFQVRKSFEFNPQGIPSRKFYHTEKKHFSFGVIQIREKSDNLSDSKELLRQYQAKIQFTNASSFPIRISFEVKNISEN